MSVFRTAGGRTVQLPLWRQEKVSCSGAVIFFNNAETGMKSFLLSCNCAFPSSSTLFSHSSMSSTGKHSASTHKRNDMI